MVTKEQAKAAVAQARILLDEAEAALIVAETFLDDLEEAGTEVEREAWFDGDWGGVVRDHINAVEETVEAH